MCQAAIPLIAKIRKWIALTPLTRQSGTAAIISAEQFVKALGTIAHQGWSLDLAKATGFTQRELLSHTINLPANTSDSTSEEEQVRCRFIQVNVMDSMFAVNYTASYLIAFESERALTWSVWAMRSIILYSASTPNSALLRTTDVREMLNGVVMFWTGIFIHRFFLDGLTVEAVECNILFIFETWSNNASSKHLGT